MSLDRWPGGFRAASNTSFLRHDSFQCADLPREILAAGPYEPACGITCYEIHRQCLLEYRRLPMKRRLSELSLPDYVTKVYDALSERFAPFVYQCGS